MLSGSQKLSIVLERGDATYRPGETVRGAVVLETDRPRQGWRLVVRLRWQVSKGSLDAASGGEETVVVSEGAVPEGTSRHAFELLVPPGPLSYEGTLFQVRWSVEARLERGERADDTVSSAVAVRLVPGPSGVVELEEPPAWTRLEDAASTRPAVVFGCFGTLLVGFALLIVWLRLTDEWRDETPALVLWGTTGAFALVGCAAMRYAQLLLRARRLVGTLALAVEPGTVERGRPLVVSVRITPPATTKLSGVEATLTGRETVLRRSGKAFSVVHREVARVERQLAGALALRVGETRELTAELAVPESGPPTFVHAVGSVAWRVEVRVLVPGLPDVTTSAAVVVVPAGFTVVRGDGRRLHAPRQGVGGDG